MNDLELISFRIISTVGTARGMFITAIQKAKNGDFEEASQLIEQGNRHFMEGHEAHMEMLTRQANGEATPLDILLIHAEDQMMSAETFKIIAEEFIDLYKRLN